MITIEELKAWRTIHFAADLPPWQADESHIITKVGPSLSESPSAAQFNGLSREENAALVAVARNNLSRLLDTAEEAIKLREALQKLSQSICACGERGGWEDFSISMHMTYREAQKILGEISK